MDEYKEPLDLDVKYIGGVHSVVLKNNNKEVSRIACERKEDIGWSCRELLRWFSKLGGISRFAESARRRQNNSTPPIGKIYHGGKPNKTKKTP